MKYSISFIILIFLFGACASAHELELIFYRAPYPLNWKTPGKLIRSMVFNEKIEIDGEKYPHPISHVNIRLQCDSEPPIFQGMTSVKSSGSYLKDLIFRGSSLDLMLINQKGRSYTRSEILHWLPRLHKLGYSRSLLILLNEGQCHRAKQYLELYKQSGLINIYGGLRSDPLLGEGAGCSAFAVSVLRILNLLPSNVAEKWQRELHMPLELFSDWERRSRISFLEFLLGWDRGWAKHDETQIRLKFWDPELMFRWTKKPVTVWDARNEEVPQGPLITLQKDTFLKTVRYHYNNVERLLSKEEVLDPASGRCRNFRPCN